MSTEKIVSDYLANFKHCLKIDKSNPHYNEIKDWCKSNMGSEFKDWFWWQGGYRDPEAHVNIKDSKVYTLFMLRWGDHVNVHNKKAI